MQNRDILNKRDIAHLHAQKPEIPFHMHIILLIIMKGYLHMKITNLTFHRHKHILICILSCLARARILRLLAFDLILEKHVGIGLPLSRNIKCALISSGNSFKRLSTRPY